MANPSHLASSSGSLLRCLSIMNNTRNTPLAGACSALVCEDHGVTGDRRPRGLGLGVSA